MLEPTSSQDTKSIFGLEIVDYSITGDINLCENHNFIIRIWVGQYMYFVNRSYASFCDLHMQLKRRYPKSNIPTIPLSGISIFAKRTSSITSHNPSSAGSGSMYSPPARDLKTTIIRQIIEQKFPINSCLIPAIPGFANVPVPRLTDVYGNITNYSGPAMSSYSKRRSSAFHKMDNNEVVTQKIGPLSTYLSNLIKIPEIAISENLLDFLDDESVNGEKIGLLPSISLVDVMLAGETPRSKTVHSISSYPLDVEMGQVVAWRFTTTNYDIGFGANLRNCDILPYQRYNSHLQEASGYLEVKESGPLNLYWDNTYSMMRNKTINFVVKVLSAADFVIAKNISSDASKDKQRYQQQRQLVSRALHKLSISALQERETQTIAIVLSSPVGKFVSADVLEDNELNVDLYENLMKLEDEKRSLQLALAASEAALLEERASSSSTSGKDSHEDTSTTSVKDTVETELSDLKTQYLYVRKRHEEDNQRNKAKIDQLTEALNEAQASKRVTIQALADVQRELADVVRGQESTRDEIIKHYESMVLEFQIAKTKISETDQVLNKLKIERMKLKKFAIEQKNENEMLRQELQRERSAKTALLMKAQEDYRQSFQSAPLPVAFQKTYSFPRPPSSSSLFSESMGLLMDENTNMDESNTPTSTRGSESFSDMSFTLGDLASSNPNLLLEGNSNEGSPRMSTNSLESLSVSQNTERSKVPSRDSTTSSGERMSSLSGRSETPPIVYSTSNSNLPANGLSSATVNTFGIALVEQQKDFIQRDSAGSSNSITIDNDSGSTKDKPLSANINFPKTLTIDSDDLDVFSVPESPLSTNRNSFSSATSSTSASVAINTSGKSHRRGNSSISQTDSVEDVADLCSSDSPTPAVEIRKSISNTNSAGLLTSTLLDNLNPNGSSLSSDNTPPRSYYSLEQTSQAHGKMNVSAGQLPRSTSRLSVEDARGSFSSTKVSGSRRSSGNSSAKSSFGF